MWIMIKNKRFNLNKVFYYYYLAYELEERMNYVIFIRSDTGIHEFVECEDDEDGKYWLKHIDNSINMLSDDSL